MRQESDDSERITSDGDTGAGMNAVHHDENNGNNAALGTDATQAGSSDTPLGQEGGVTGGNAASGAAGTDGDETRDHDKKVQG